MNNKLYSFNNNFIIIFSLIFLIIIKIIYSFNNGYVAPDTEWFLKIAEIIYQNQSLFYAQSINMPGYETDLLDNNLRFAGTWPPVYPFSIAIIKTLTGLSFFWSSKIINIICFISIVIYFDYRFKNKILTYFILLNATLLEVLCFSLTEYVFLTLLLFSTEFFYKYIKKNQIRYLLLCLLFSNLLFLTRYNGLYIQCVFLIYFLFHIYKIKAFRKKEFSMFIFFVFNFTFSVTYLSYLNDFTGSYSGSTNRQFREDYLLEIIYILKSIVVELNYIISDPFNSLNIARDNIKFEIISILVVLFLQVIPLFVFKFNIKSSIKNTYSILAKDDYVLLYLINILFYFISINLVIIIWMVDHLYYRSMSPITLMVLLLTSYVFKVNFNYRLKNYLLYIILLSLIANLFLPIIIYFFKY